jgi:hypothetical protein
MQKYKDAAEWLEKVVKDYENQNNITSATAKVYGDIGLLTSDIIHIYDDHLVNGELPFQIDNCSIIQIYSPLIKSFKNFPKNINKGNLIGNCKINFERQTSSATDEFHHITSLDGITPEIHGGYRFINLPNVSFHNVSDYIKSCQWCTISRTYSGPLLSFLKINGLTALNTGVFPQSEIEEKALKAVTILNKYLTTTRNISACQTELLRNGLKEYAKL